MLKGSSVGSYLWESCGKVFLLGSGLPTRRHQSGKQTKKQKKSENVGKYMAYQPFLAPCKHLSETDLLRR